MRIATLPFTHLLIYIEVSFPYSGKNYGNLPHLSFQSSSSSDTESTMFSEGKQTVRHLGEHSNFTFPKDILQNGYHKNQKENLVASLDNGLNPKLGAYGECQSLSVMHMEADNPQAQVTLCCTHSGKGNCSRSRNGSLKHNLYQSCKYQKNLDHKESLYPPFTPKIRKASEILANDLTDEDVSYQNKDMLFSPEDEEITKILKNLKMVSEIFLLQFKLTDFAVVMYLCLPLKIFFTIHCILASDIIPIVSINVSYICYLALCKFFFSISLTVGASRLIGGTDGLASPVIWLGF